LIASYSAAGDEAENQENQEKQAQQAGCGVRKQRSENYHVDECSQALLHARVVS